VEWLDDIAIEEGPGHSTRAEIEAVFAAMAVRHAKGDPGVTAFMGVPPRRIMVQARKLSSSIVDLDMPRDDVSKSEAEIFLPRIYCATLRTVLANALSLPIDWMILATGYDKCDGGRFVAEIIRREKDIPVLTIGNPQTARLPTPNCDSHLPLKDKVNRIIDWVGGVEVETPQTKDDFKAGFWGVPPHDQEVLAMFPKETRLLGWTRMMEAGVPADIDLELWVPGDLPTIFYAQAFCQKNGIAKYLAEKHNGLYVEVDHHISSSAKAKIEAFLKFRTEQAV
jgi:hypothetical protein